MKPRGYYWCDRCDDSAYGKICRHCQSPARWIASEPAIRRITEPEAKVRFQQMRAVVAAVGRDAKI